MEHLRMAALEAISKPEPSAILKPSEIPLRDAIKKMLVVLAELRQASVSEATLKSYSARLSSFPLSELRPAFNRISQRPRAEGETAFPALPDIEEDVLYLRSQRRAKELQEARDLRDAAEFDKILNERIEDGGSEDEFCKRYPSLAENWRRWKQAGCPAARSPEPAKAASAKSEPNYERARVQGQ